MRTETCTRSAISTPSKYSLIIHNIQPVFTSPRLSQTCSFAVSLCASWFRKHLHFVLRVSLNLLVFLAKGRKKLGLFSCRNFHFNMYFASQWSCSACNITGRPGGWSRSSCSWHKSWGECVLPATWLCSCEVCGPLWSAVWDVGTAGQSPSFHRQPHRWRAAVFLQK